MRVLVACEFSGVVRDSFRRLGHDAWSCDLEGVEPEGEWPNYHLEGDCRWFMNNPLYPAWDMLIAFPPCTYLCNSGVRWLDSGRNGERMAKMILAAELFNDLLGESVTSAAASIRWIAVENPIQHKYARERIRKPDQIIQPWQFGHGETKATCLWLKNLPQLVPTNVVAGRRPRVHHESPGPERQKNRSRTLTGIAEAMASQWSGIL